MASYYINHLVMLPKYCLENQFCLWDSETQELAASIQGLISSVADTKKLVRESLEAQAEAIQCSPISIQKL